MLLRGGRCQFLSEHLHFAADDCLGELGVVARHVGVRVAENLGQHVDRHPVFDGHAGEGVAGAVGGQHLVDAAHGRDLLHVGVHLLVARRGKHAPASEARLVPLVAAQDFERGRKQRDAAHDGGLFARLVDPPPPLVVLREVFAPQVVGVGEGQPRQAAEDEDVADACQPAVELLTGQQFQFMRREVLFGLHLVLFEFIVAERIFRDPLVAQAVEDEVAQTVHDGDRPVVAAAVGGLQEEVEAVQKLVVHPFNGNILGFAALGEILFEVAQQPLVLVCRALRDAHAHFGRPFRIRKRMVKVSCLITRDILRIDKTSARKLYCGVKRSKTMYCGLKRWQSRFRKPKSALPTFLPPNSFLRLAFRFRFGESVETFAKW